MKNTWYVLLLGVTIAACSKSNDPTPDAGSQVAGTYTMSYVEADSAGVVLYKYTLPATNTAGTQTLSGLLTARRDSANAVFLTQTIKLTGQTDQTSVIGEISLRSNGSGYDMYLSNQKIGTADGKTISIDDQQTDATTGTKYRDVITAAK
ncbi:MULTISPECIES: hypothetical protein [unclassified Spirosoma]|uniref:hypothetical protein n=1 Tax=unclassified Spirosoma TaxID=2621999 RepID=UPI0009634B7D|nr:MULTISPECIES: hypothetical protein [unclassified Spirosoma]MBN8826600.1 hypothetical protein [Spirosoma sp.]OJW72828.1 MAG: hypothetical protein BGO59_08520 [Spirosoma sp. 48-14]